MMKKESGGYDSQSNYGHASYDNDASIRSSNAHS